MKILNEKRFYAYSEDMGVIPTILKDFLTYQNGFLLNVHVKILKTYVILIIAIGMNYQHTSSPLIAAETIREGKEIYGVSNSASISGLNYLEQGGSFPPIILLTSDNENYIILEGHSRMTVYGLAPSFFEGSKCYIGICEEDELLKWNS